MCDRDMLVLREGFGRSYPVTFDLDFTPLLRAIDVADEEYLQIVGGASRIR